MSLNVTICHATTDGVRTTCCFVQRADDKPEALKNRLEEYTKMTIPILKHYEPAGVVSKVSYYDRNRTIRNSKSDSALAFKLCAATC